MSRDALIVELLWRLIGCDKELKTEDDTDTAVDCSLQWKTISNLF